MKLSNTPIIIPAGKGQTIFHKTSEQAHFIVEKDAAIEYIIIFNDDGDEHATVHFRLSGPNASVHIYGLVIAKKDAQKHLSLHITHAAPYTKSFFSLRSTVDDTSNLDCYGRITIEKNMNGCEARQEMHTLVLSEDAHVNTIPELQINNNDVKCSHAVTTTYIDEEKKFYLESRGMSEDEAERSVVTGHFTSILDGTKEKSIRNQINDILIKKINPLL